MCHGVFGKNPTPIIEPGQVWLCDDVRCRVTGLTSTHITYKWLGKYSGTSGKRTVKTFLANRTFISPAPEGNEEFKRRVEVLGDNAAANGLGRPQPEEVAPGFFVGDEVQQKDSRQNGVVVTQNIFFARWPHVAKLQQNHIPVQLENEGVRQCGIYRLVNLSRPAKKKGGLTITTGKGSINKGDLVYINGVGVRPQNPVGIGQRYRTDGKPVKKKKLRKCKAADKKSVLDLSANRSTALPKDKAIDTLAACADMMDRHPWPFTDYYMPFPMESEADWKERCARQWKEEQKERKNGK
jgi:hypothetical protein